jgi:hypothetical protein
MILDAARLAFANLFAAETRAVFWKVIGLTLLSLIALWFALRELFVWLALPWIDALMPGTPAWAGWLTFVVGIFASLGLALALALLLAPVTAMIAGLFLDDVAEVVEKRDYPGEAPGTPLPLAEAIVGSAKFLGVVILGNVVALFLLLVPGVNLIAFFHAASPAHRGAALPQKAPRDGLPWRPDRGSIPGGAAPQPADTALCRRHDGASAQDALRARPGCCRKFHGRRARQNIDAAACPYADDRKRWRTA